MSGQEEKFKQGNEAARAAENEPEAGEQSNPSPEVRKDAAAHVGATASKDVVRELDRRAGDGIVVTLLWNSLTDQVSVALADARADAHYKFDVASQDALEAFHHPYAYAANPRQSGESQAA